MNTASAFVLAVVLLGPTPEKEIRIQYYGFQTLLACNEEMVIAKTRLPPNVKLKSATCQEEPPGQRTHR